MYKIIKNNPNTRKEYASLAAKILKKLIITKINNYLNLLKINNFLFVFK